MALVWHWQVRAAGLQAWESGVAPSVHKRSSGRSCSTRDVLSRSFGWPNTGGLRPSSSQRDKYSTTLLASQLRSQLACRPRECLPIGLSCPLAWARHMGATAKAAVAEECGNNARRVDVTVGHPLQEPGQRDVPVSTAPAWQRRA